MTRNTDVKQCKVCWGWGISNCKCEVFRPDGERRD